MNCWQKPGSNSASSGATATSEALVRFDTNYYSLPVEHAHKPVLLRASTTRVFIYHGGEEIACHERCWQRERHIFDPLHYLSLLERKPGSLNHARPLAGWDLPEEFAALRRRLEAQRADGVRDDIRVLLLLRYYPLGRLGKASTAEIA